VNSDELAVLRSCIAVVTRQYDAPDTPQAVFARAALESAERAAAIVQSLAANEVLTQSRKFDGLCVFCGAQREPYARPPFPHKADCLWAQASALVKGESPVSA
jgi:hypothetical protein